MKIINKLSLSFSFIVIIVLVAGASALDAINSEMRGYITNESIPLVVSVTKNIDQHFHTYMDIFSEFAHREDVVEMVHRSNQQYETLSDIQKHIDTLDQIWTTDKSEPPPKSITDLLNTNLSIIIKNKIDRYKKEHGNDLFSEVFITNQWGAVIALSQKTTDFRQDDEPWWQEAKKRGRFISQPHFDKSTKQYAISISFSLKDNQENFIGVIKIVFNFDFIGRLIQETPELSHHHNHNHYTHWQLLNKKGQLLYSTDTYTPLEDRSQHFDTQKMRKLGSGVIEFYREGHTDIFSVSKGYQDFPSLGWILVLEHEKPELSAAISVVQDRILFASFLITAVGLLIGFIVLFRIVTPINTLTKKTRMIGQGNLEITVKTYSNDEIGALSTAFQNMANNLKDVTVSRNLLKKEIQSRKIMEQRLLQEQQFTRILLSSTGEGIYGVDEQNRCIFVNRAALTLLGFRRIHLIGQKMHPLIHHTHTDGTHYPEDRCRINRIIKNNEKTRVKDELFWRKDGTSFPVEYSAYPMKDKLKIVGAVVVFHDNTESKRMEEKTLRLLKSTRAINQLLSSTLLNQSLEEHLSLALTLILEGSWIAIEEKGAIFLVNESSGKLQLAAHKNLPKLEQNRCQEVPALQCRCRKDKIQRKIAYTSCSNQNKKNHQDLQPELGHYCVPIVLRSQLLGVFHVYPQKNHSLDMGEEQFLTAMADAIAGLIGRHQADEDVKKKNAQLVHSDRLTAIGELATGIAHEINQPLTYISGCIQGLSRDFNRGILNQQRWQPKLLKAYDKVNQIDKVLRHIRIFGRSNEQTIDDTPQKHTCHIPTVLDDTLLLMGKKITQSTIQLDIQLDDDLPQVSVDPNQMEQVFVNLLQNAIHALKENQENPCITIIATQNPTKKTITLNFSDNGIGMPEPIRIRIFEPFFTTKPVGDGTGLGLSIIHGIIGDFQGQIQCASGPNQGTTFTITLPITDGHNTT